MSQTSVSGLVGVSANSSFVCGRIAAFHSATSVWETKVVSTPKRANPVPSKVSHNTLIEIVWTLVPVLILFGLGAAPALIVTIIFAMPAVVSGSLLLALDRTAGTFFFDAASVGSFCCASR